MKLLSVSASLSIAQTSPTYLILSDPNGNKRAYIKLENITELSGVGSNRGKSVDMTITSVIDGKIKFNLTTGLTESCKMSMSIAGSGRDLEDDDVKEFFMGLNAKLKQKFK